MTKNIHPDGSSTGKPAAWEGDTPAPPSHGQVLRSLTRLVIGGVEISADELLRRLKTWESEVEHAFSEASAENTAGERSASIADMPSTRARYAVIGLIFEMQDGVRSGLSTLGRMDRLISRLVSPVLEPLLGSRLLTPTRRRYNRLVARGQSEIERWVSIGQIEDARSRMLAEKGFDEVVDTYIEYLASNPELQELVQSQSTGLANEVVEEVRERTVSADTFLEGLARSLLRRLPRSALPEPPAALRTHATSLRPAKKGRTTRQ